MVGVNAILAIIEAKEMIVAAMPGDYHGLGSSSKWILKRPFNKYSLQKAVQQSHTVVAWRRFVRSPSLCRPIIKLG